MNKNPLNENAKTSLVLQDLNQYQVLTVDIPPISGGTQNVSF